MENPPQHLAEEFAEEYKAGYLTRREFLRRLTLLTGGTLAALSLAGSLGCGTEQTPKSTAALAAATATPLPPATATP